MYAQYEHFDFDGRTSLLTSTFFLSILIESRQFSSPLFQPLTTKIGWQYFLTIFSVIDSIYNYGHYNESSIDAVENSFNSGILISFAIVSFMKCTLTFNLIQRH
jgi:hypothetical protein